MVQYWNLIKILFVLLFLASVSHAADPDLNITPDFTPIDRLSDDRNTAIINSNFARIWKKMFWNADSIGINIYNLNSGAVSVSSVTVSSVSNVSKLTFVDGSSVTATNGNLTLHSSTIIVPGKLVVLEDYSGWATYVASSCQTLDRVNISSVARTGAGQYTIYPAHPLANPDYAIWAFPMVNIGVTHMICEQNANTAVPRTTASFGIRCVSMPGNAETDPYQFSVGFNGRISLP